MVRNINQWLMVPSGSHKRRAFARPTKMKPCAAGYVAVSQGSSLQHFEQSQPHRSTPHIVVKMANRGYDVVVDVDTEV